MSDLRDEIDDLLVQYAIRMESPIITSTATGHFVDDILASVAAALTSDAAMRSVCAMYDEADIETLMPGEAPYGDVPFIVTAALRAAGIVKGEGDGA